MTPRRQPVSPRDAWHPSRDARGVELDLPTNEWVQMAKVYPVFDGPYPHACDARTL